MKILLIGGTGTISLSVTQLLLRLGHKVTLLNRGSRPLPEGAASLVADINDEAAARRALEGQSFDVVANFIAFQPAQAERDIRLFSGRCGQYIFISSVSAYQKPLSMLPVTESTPLHNPYWAYSRNKAACEEVLLGAWRTNGFPVTIIRPGHTYDAAKLPLGVHGGKGHWVTVQRMLQRKPVLIHGDGASLWTFTHARDLAKGFAGLVGNPHALGQAVHITSDEVLCWNDAYRALAGLLGVPLNAAYVPSTLLSAAGQAAGYDYEGTLLGDKAISTVYDNSKIKALVPGFCATTLFANGLRECLYHLLNTPAAQQEDPAFDAFSDKVAVAMDAARASLV